MSDFIEKNANWRTRMSGISTVVSISLVLFVTGLLGTALTYSKTISDLVKEKFQYSVYLRDGLKEVDIRQFKKMIDAQDYVLSTEYIDKDQALALLQEDLDEDGTFDDMIGGESPLPASIELKIKAEYTHPDSLKNIMDHLSSTNGNLIAEIGYTKDNIEQIHANVDKISIWLLAISGLLLFIAIGLINNTLRLRVYSKRFLIRTMQLIGAKWSFIRRPFIYSAVMQGIIAALLAVLGLVAFLNVLVEEIPQLALVQERQNLQWNIAIYLSLIGLGIFITWISTYLAVSKFLRLKTDDLYY